MTDENYEKFCQEIDELHQKAKEHRLKLSETTKPQFNTIEEAMAYYNAIPFSEWENKMLDRLDDRQREMMKRTKEEFEKRNQTSWKDEK